MAFTRVKVTERVAAPADKVWEVIGAFGGLPKIMSSLVPKSRLNAAGNIRILKLAGARKNLQERLLKYDSATRTQVYEIVEDGNTPVPFKNYTATIKVKPASARACTVEWSSQYEVKKTSSAAECKEMAQLVYATGIEGTRKALGVSAAKKAPAKKAPAKKAAAKKKTTAKKAPAKKAAAKKKTAAKKAPAKNTAAKKKPAAKKKTAAKRR